MPQITENYLKLPEIAKNSQKNTFIGPYLRTDCDVDFNFLLYSWSDPQKLRQNKIAKNYQKLLEIAKKVIFIQKVEVTRVAENYWTLPKIGSMIIIFAFLSVKNSQ